MSNATSWTLYFTKLVSLMEKSLSKRYSRENDQSSRNFFDKKSPLHDIQNSDSSVFLSPPGSLEVQRTRSIVSTLADPDRCSLFLDKKGSIRIDFISKLYEQSLEMVIGNRLFRNLSDFDLVRSSHVNRTWRDVLTRRNLLSGQRIRRFLLRKKKAYAHKGKENRPLKAIQYQQEKTRPCSESPSVNSSFKDCNSSINQSSHLGLASESSENLEEKVSPSNLIAGKCLSRSVPLGTEGQDACSSSSKGYLIGSKPSKKRLKRLSFS